MTKKINYIFLGLLFIYSLYCFTQFGRTWDTFFHYNVGKDRLDYLFSLGNNKIDTDIFIRKFYPGAYSTIAAFFAQLFPKKYIIEALYLINFTFSTLAIFGIYKVSTELFNKQIGKITFLICFFNPIFFGHMAINSVDTIIAFANIWVIYLIIKYLKNQKNIEKKKKYIILCGLTLGLGLGVRYSFLVTLLPIFLFLILDIFYFKTLVNKKFSKKLLLRDSLIVLVIAYLFMVFFWPQTHQNIFTMPIKLALEGFSIGFGVPLVLVNGETFYTHEFPKDYVLINLFYKMPEFFIFSFIIFAGLFFKIGSYFKKKIKGFYLKISLIIIIISFPNLLILFTPYSIYDGIRLFLYLIPYICIIPAILIFFIFKMINRNVYKFLFSFLVLVKIFLIYNFFSLTPYHYVYLNIFAGKYAKNAEKFENDYWGISTKKLVSSLKDHIDILENSEIKIATCGVPIEGQRANLKKIKKLKFKIVDKKENFDFIIMNNRIIWDLKSNLDNPKTAKTCFQKYKGEDIASIKRRGLTLSKITKNIN